MYELNVAIWGCQKHVEGIASKELSSKSTSEENQRRKCPWSIVDDLPEQPSNKTERSGDK